MKTMAIVGTALIVIGLAALAYQGITYTSRETAAGLSSRGPALRPPGISVINAAGGFVHGQALVTPVVLRAHVGVLTSGDPDVRLSAKRQ